MFFMACSIIEVVDLYKFKQQQHSASISLHTSSKDRVQYERHSWFGWWTLIASRRCVRAPCIGTQISTCICILIVDSYNGAKLIGKKICFLALFLLISYEDHIHFGASYSLYQRKI
jgi:hypothetical protein